MGYGRVPRQFLMAITATDRGTATDSTTGTSLTINGVTMSVGSTGILCIAFDNAVTAASNIAATSYTDSAGNIWYVRANRAEGTALANVEAAFLTAQITSAFSSSVTLTLTFNTTVPNKAWTWTEASTNVTGAMVLWRYAPNTNIISTALSATSTPSFGTTNDAGEVGDLMVGMMATENPDIFSAGDSDTTGGAWSTAQHTGVGSGTSGISICTQNKVTTVYGDQTYNITLTGSVDSRAGVLVLSEVDNKVRTLFGNTTAEASTTITLALPITAGNMCVLAVATDNLGSGGNTTIHPSSLTDSQSNTWTRRINGFCDPGAAAAGVELSMYTAPMTTGLGMTDNVPTGTYLTGVSPASKIFIIYEFAPAVGGNSITYVSSSFGNNSGASPTTAPQVTTSSITSNDWVIAMTGAEAEDNLTADSDTTNGTWRQQSLRANGAAATAMMGAVQAKQVTATATQSYDVTLGASADWATGWVSLHDSSPTGGLTASQKAAFFQMF